MHDVEWLVCHPLPSCARRTSGPSTSPFACALNESLGHAEALPAVAGKDNWTGSGFRQFARPGVHDQPGRYLIMRAKAL